MVAWLLQRAGQPALGFSWSLQVAAAALLVGGMTFAALALRSPLSRR